MTKAELLHRFRWVFVVLPLSTVVGFHLLGLFAWEMKSPMLRAFLRRLPLDLDVTVGVWFVIALLCSAHTGFWIASNMGFVRGAAGGLRIAFWTSAMLGAHITVTFFIFLFLLSPSP